MSRRNESSKLARLWPSGVILGFVVGYLVIGAMTLDETTRVVPLLAGGVTLLLLAIDMLRVTLGRDAGDDGAPEGGGVSAVPARREFKAILFVAGGVAGIWFAGFLVALPLYLFASIAFLGEQRVRTAGTVAVIATLLVYVVFEVLLDYTLYPGLLFY